MSSPECTSPVKLPPLKKIRSITDFNKCIICQAAKEEKLSKANGNGISSFLYSLDKRRDEVYIRLETQLEDLSSGGDLWWHRKCFRSYTSKTNLSYTSGQTILQPIDTNMPPGMSVLLRSSTSPLNLSLCIFCQK